MDILITLCVIAAAVMAARAFSRTRALAANILALKARRGCARSAAARSRGRAGGALPAANAGRNAACRNRLRTHRRRPEGVAGAGSSAAGRLPRRKALGGDPGRELAGLAGRLALALGGAFLVKLSIDHGLLTPGGARRPRHPARHRACGAARSGSLWGEPADRAPVECLPGARRRRVRRRFSPASTPPTSSTGCCRRPGLPAARPRPAAATVLMSLQHGPFVAALGLTGAFAVPLLVGASRPRALPLFAYLSLVSAGSLALLRHRAWWWLAWVCAGRLDRLGAAVAGAALRPARCLGARRLPVGSAGLVCRVAPRHSAGAVPGRRDRRADGARRRAHGFLGDIVCCPPAGAGRDGYGAASLGCAFLTAFVAARLRLPRQPSSTM